MLGGSYTPYPAASQRRLEAAFARGDAETEVEERGVTYVVSLRAAAPT